MTHFESAVIYIPAISLVSVLLAKFLQGSYSFFSLVLLPSMHFVSEFICLVSFSCLCYLIIVRLIDSCLRNKLTKISQIQKVRS